MIPTKLFRNGDELFIVLREFPIEKLNKKDGSINVELFNAWRDYLGSDKVFKNQTHFVYCEKIQDLEWEAV